MFGGITGASRMLPILLLPFYLSAIPVEDYGRIEVLVALFNFVIIFGSIQLETAVQRYMYKVDNKLNHVCAISLLTFSLSIFVFFTILFFSKEISYFLFETDIESENIIIIALSCVFFNVSSILLIYFRYSEQEKIFVIISLSQVLTTSAITYFLVVIERLGNFGYVMGILIGWLLVVVLSFSSILRKDRKLKPDFSMLKELVSFSLPQLPARLGSFFIQFGNRFVVLYYFGVQTVALLGLSVKFAAPFQLMYIAFTMAWSQYLYKNEECSDLEVKINFFLKIQTFIIIISSIIMHFLGGWIIDQYFDAKYEEVKSLVVIAMLPTGLLIVKEVLEVGIKLSGKTKNISYSYFLSVIVTFFLMMISRDLHDVLLSSLIGSMVLLLATCFFSERNYHIKYSRSTLLILFLFIPLLILFNSKS